MRGRCGHKFSQGLNLRRKEIDREQSTSLFQTAMNENPSSNPGSKFRYPRHEYVITNLLLLFILTSFGQSPERNQNQYTSVTRPFPLKVNKKEKFSDLVLHKMVLLSNHWSDLISRVTH